MMDLPPYDQLLAQARTVAAEVREAEAPQRPLPNLRWRNTAIIGGTGLVMFAYGYGAWWSDGFTSRFRNRNEGWFDRRTEFSGIDKLGHAYFAYAATRGLDLVFQGVGNDAVSARRLSALTIWGAMGAVEVLDAFSKHYTFSQEDFFANTVGASLGWFMAANPEWDDRIDFRLSYHRTPLSKWNPPGDYGGHRYWLVLKADGFESLRNVPVLKYLEFAVGYGAPGVDTPDEWIYHDFALRRRERLFGISLNLSRVVADVFYGGRKSTTRTQRVAERTFDLWQHPGIYYRARDIDAHIVPPVCCGPPPPR